MAPVRFIGELEKHLENDFRAVARNTCSRNESKTKSKAEKLLDRKHYQYASVNFFHLMEWKRPKCSLYAMPSQVWSQQTTQYAFPNQIFQVSDRNLALFSVSIFRKDLKYVQNSLKNNCLCLSVSVLSVSSLLKWLRLSSQSYCKHDLFIIVSPTFSLLFYVTNVRISWKHWYSFH